MSIFFLINHGLKLRDAINIICIVSESNSFRKSLTQKLLSHSRHPNFVTYIPSLEDSDFDKITLNVLTYKQSRPSTWRLTYC